MSNEQYLIEKNGNKYEVIIGLEVHAQVSSESKLFSASATKFGSEPNTQVSIVDAAFPGMLPVINEFCVKQAVKTGIGLNAKINKRSIFDRKNYFYADLPQGYQISQYKDPVVGEGSVVLDMPFGPKNIGIERLHLEQDAGKSIHDIDPTNTLVDLNRSGVALMEIVSKPDLRSPEEVNLYIKKLRSIMRYLGTCDGNMQEGSLRADVNVSVRKLGTDKFGTRCEIKNMNSIKFMQMVGRGTRLCEDLFGPGKHKSHFQIFDHWGVVEAHALNDYEPSVSNSKPLAQKLFESRVALARFALEMAEPATFDRTVEQLLSMIKRLDQESILVREQWRAMQAVSRRDDLMKLAPETVVLLEAQISPLMRYLDVRGLSPAYNWDLLLTELAGAKLIGSSLLEDLAGEAADRVAALPTTINRVKEKEELLKK